MKNIMRSNNARATLHVCYKNKMAWRLAGAKLRSRLRRSYIVELEDKYTEVEIKRGDMEYMKEIFIW